MRNIIHGVVIFGSDSHKKLLVLDVEETKSRFFCAALEIFQTPSYDRFCLFEMERKSKDFRGMDDNVAYKNKQIDNVEISNEGRRALREKLREVKPKVEEPIGYELTIQDTNEVEWEHYTSMREYSGLTLKDGKYNLEDVMKSMMDAYETRYNYIVKEHENGERRISYDLTGENSLTLDEDLAGLDRAYNKRLANLAGYIVCQQTNDGSKFFQTTNVKKNTAEQKEYIDTAVSMMEKAQKRFLEMREEPKYTAGIAKSVIGDIMSSDKHYYWILIEEVIYRNHTIPYLI